MKYFRKSTKLDIWYFLWVYYLKEKIFYSNLNWMDLYEQPTLAAFVWFSVLI